MHITFNIKTHKGDNDNRSEARAAGMVCQEEVRFHTFHQIVRSIRASRKQNLKGTPRSGQPKVTTQAEERYVI